MRPAALRRLLLAHFETWRPYTTAYVGLVGLAGATLASTDTPGWRLLGAWAVPTIGWLAGLYGGDYFDRELDAVAKPGRPIPSGRMSARAGLIAMVSCVGLGALGGLLLNWRSMMLVVAATIGGISYNTWFKARGFAGNLVRGGLTAFAFLFGTMAVVPYPRVELLSVAALLWLHDAGTNLVGSLRDLDGDRRGGYATVPVKHGVRAALICATVLYASWLAIAISLPEMLAAPAGSAGFVVLLTVAAAMAAGALLVVLLAPRPLARRPALRAHEVLVLERIVLAGALIRLGSKPDLALPVVALALAVTWSAQHFMRPRYEFTPAELEAQATVRRAT